MKFADVKDIAIVAVVVGGAFTVYKFLNKVPEGLTKAGEAIGGAVFELFHPNPTGSDIDYIVNFAGGEKHAIPIKSNQEPLGVDSAGNFTFRGKRFVMRDRIVSGVRQHWAFNP